jgi:hypothetical protein
VQGRNPKKKTVTFKWNYDKEESIVETRGRQGRRRTTSKKRLDRSQIEKRGKKQQA